MPRRCRRRQGRCATQDSDGQDRRTVLREIKADPQLLEVALSTGRQAFAYDCQPCHGGGGGGRPGYPALAAGAWIWGGSLDAIQQTMTHGIRSGDADARDSAMPRFGADGILTAAQVQQVADYVWAFLWTQGRPWRTSPAAQSVFADNCAVCHGENGQGNREVGAPRLASQVHLYGDTRARSWRKSPRRGMGVMPNWNTRLDPGNDQGRRALCPLTGRRRIAARRGSVGANGDAGSARSTEQLEDCKREVQRASSLYADHVRIYPKTVHGPVRRSNGRS